MQFFLSWWTDWCIKNTRITQSRISVQSDFAEIRVLKFNFSSVCKPRDKCLSIVIKYSYACFLLFLTKFHDNFFTSNPLGTNKDHRRPLGQTPHHRPAKTVFSTVPSNSNWQWWTVELRAGWRGVPLSIVSRSCKEQLKISLCWPVVWHLKFFSVGWMITCRHLNILCRINTKGKWQIQRRMIKLLGLPLSEILCIWLFCNLQTLFSILGLTDTFRKLGILLGCQILVSCEILHCWPCVSWTYNQK